MGIGRDLPHALQWREPCLGQGAAARRTVTSHWGGSRLRWGLPRERREGERRVALVPEAAGAVVAAGHRVYVEQGAGERAGFTDEAYRQAGAEIVDGAQALAADLVVKVRGPVPEEIPSLAVGSVVVAMLQPLADPSAAKALADRGVHGFSLDLVPRITRAQSMDVLSAMSTVGGYRAALEAALLVRRFFPMLMTAAGTVTPARVLILGAGVAGLQAIATARRLGAVVSAFDARPAAREQVESLGASFLGLPPLAESAEGQGGYARQLAADEEEREREFLADPVAKADVVITTALVPGAAAPRLISEEMVKTMRPGSVIVDLAAEAGGNCALTVAGETVMAHGVVVHGPLNLAAEMPAPASQLYARALRSFVKNMEDAGMALPVPDPAPDLPDDEIVRATAVAYGGAVVHEATRKRLEGGQG